MGTNEHPKDRLLNASAGVIKNPNHPELASDGRGVTRLSPVVLYGWETKEFLRILGGLANHILGGQT